MVFPKNATRIDNSSSEYSRVEKSPLKRLPRSSADSYNDPENESNSDLYKIPQRRSEPRHRDSFDMNTPRKNKSVLIPFDDIKISVHDRYPLEEELQRERDLPVGAYQPRKMPPKYIKQNRNLKKSRL